MQQEVLAATHVEVFYGPAMSMSLRAYRTLAGSLLASSIHDQEVELQLKLTTRLETAGVELLRKLDYERLQTRASFKRSEPCHCERNQELHWSQTRAYETNLECVLSTFRHCEASNLRDHVYAFIGMSNCPVKPATSIIQAQETGIYAPTITIDYSRTPSQIFQDMARYIMSRDGNIQILFGHLPEFRGSPAIALPSWTPDWRVLRTHSQRVSESLRLGSNFYFPEQAKGVLSITGLTVATIIGLQVNPIRGLDDSKEPRYDCRISFFSYRSNRGFVCTQGQAKPGDLLVVVDSANFFLLLRPSNPAAAGDSSVDEIKTAEEFEEVERKLPISQECRFVGAAHGLHNLLGGRNDTEVAKPVWMGEFQRVLNERRKLDGRLESFKLV